MQRRDFITWSGGAAAALVCRTLAARAQQVGKTHRIGFLGNSTAALEANLVGPFRDGLRALGYEEGRNMGATLSLVWCCSGWMHFGHIGDSRIYHLPKHGTLSQLTDDHTHVGWLRRAGRINEREARTHPRRNVAAHLRPDPGQGRRGRSTHP